MTLILTDQYETPSTVFDPLVEKYRFVFDLSASTENTKCGEKFFSLLDDSLTRDWAELSKAHEVGWLWNNPPYSKPNLDLFVGKARLEVQRGAAIVQLVPATPGAGWCQRHIFTGHDLITACMQHSPMNPWLKGWEVECQGTGYRLKVRFLARRLSFLLNKKNTGTASTDSMLLEWRPRRLC